MLGHEKAAAFGCHDSCRILCTISEAQEIHNIQAHIFPWEVYNIGCGHWTDWKNGQEISAFNGSDVVEVGVFSTFGQSEPSCWMYRDWQSFRRYSPSPTNWLTQKKRSRYTGKLWQMSWVMNVSCDRGTCAQWKCCSSAVGVDSHEVVRKLKLGWFCEREFVHVCTWHMLSSDAGGSSVAGKAVRARWKDHGTYTQAGGPIGLGSWVLGQNWALHRTLCTNMWNVLQCTPMQAELHQSP